MNDHQFLDGQLKTPIYSEQHFEQLFFILWRTPKCTGKHTFCRASIFLVTATFPGFLRVDRLWLVTFRVTMVSMFKFQVNCARSDWLKTSRFITDHSTIRELVIIICDRFDIKIKDHRASQRERIRT